MAVPFLRDWDTHARFLVALPLLIVAELVVHQRMRLVVKQFLERNLIPPSASSPVRCRHRIGVSPAQLGAGRSAADRARLRRRRLVVWRQYVVLDHHWYSTNGRRPGLTFTGIWYGYVSLPLFQFLLSLVLPDVHLGAPPLARVAHRAEPRSHASGPRGRPGLPRQHGYASCPWRWPTGRCAGQIVTASSPRGRSCPSSRSSPGSSWPSCCAWYSARSLVFTAQLGRPSEQAAASMARSPNATCASSTPSGCAVGARRRAIGR